MIQREDGTAHSEPDLRRRLHEAEETLAAIRLGEVDAVVVDAAGGQQVYCLESPEAPFRIFVERMQEGALTVSGDGTIVYCNPFFARLVELPIEHVRGHALESFITPEQQQGFHKMLQSAAGEAVHGESVLRSASGRNVPVQLAFNRLPAEQVRMFGVVITDFSERDRATQLELQRQAAEDAKAARDQFLAVMSHELRTPLGAILGWAQVLSRQDNLPELVQQGLEVVVRNAWAQSYLIEDLMDVSRIFAGKLRLELKPTELGAVIRAAVASVQPSAEARRITMDTRLALTPLRVAGDGNRLQQIVSNLLSNAVKFSADGSVVEVTLRQQHGAAEIEVADAGVGIAPQYLPHIFELYHQIEGPLQDSGGLGLGLAIVKQLVELHGGEVAASSAGEGQGALFTVRLPLLEDAAEAPAFERVAPANRTALAGRRVLVVEDQADERAALVHLLESAGAEVITAASAAEALNLLERVSVALLISDIRLSGTDGFELIRRVRAAGLSGRDLPAVAITAFAGRDDRRQALMAGYQMHVPKPIDQDELLTVVASLVDQPNGGDNSNG